MGLLAKYRFFWETEAPTIIYLLYPLFSLKRKLSKSADRAIISKISRELDGLGRFNANFFDGNAAEWIKVFQRQQLQNQKLDILEIGSWEGRSAVFFLHYFPSATVTCVDTWEGSDEHSKDETLQNIETLYDSNLAQFCERVKKFKGTSLQFFAGSGPTEKYDLVYIDGSHYVDDVACDILNAFRCLRPNGLLICDDYLWNWYPRSRDNPAIAVHYLLRQKKELCKILNVTGYQIIIKKLKNTNYA